MQVSISDEARRLGFDASMIKTAFDVLKRASTSGVFPGFVALITRKQEIVAEASFGHRMLIPDKREMEVDTIFDVASLTKVVVTTTLVMMLLEKGKIWLDSPVSEILQEFLSEKKRTTTIRNLLTHTSGLPAWKPFYKQATGRDAILRLVLSADPEYSPGTREEYSDLNFILLGLLTENIFGRKLDEEASDRIFVPLGMGDSLFNPPQHLRERIAATERMTEEPRCGKILLGEVHDENAYAMGGVAGHAGLFTTARDLAAFSCMILGRGSYRDKRVLSTSAVGLMMRNQNLHIRGRYGLGWMTNSRWAAGALFSEQSFGHTGFTGTSLWMDPSKELSTILLTNAIHPSRTGKNLASVRVCFNNAVAASLRDA